MRFAMAAVLPLLMLMLAGQPVGAQPTQLSVVPAATGLPGDLSLVWNSVPYAFYQVQTTTNVTDPSSWQTLDVVSSSSNSAVYTISSRPPPSAPSAPTPAAQFYRLALQQPQISSVEPTFVSSAGGPATLYLLGQLLPSNATVVINGQDFTPTIINSNGVWASVSLSGLPAGTVITSITVIDNNTHNGVATFPALSTISYGTSESNEQLQGPPGEPRASAAWPNECKMQVQIGMVSLADGVQNGNETDVDCGGGCCVSPGTGELRCAATDLAVAGRGLDFAWTRTYRSRTGPTTAQGAGWDLPYDVSIAQQGNGTVVLSTGDGRSETFYPNGQGGWSRDEYFVSVGDLNGDGMPDVLFADGASGCFNPSGAAAEVVADHETGTGTR